MNADPDPALEEEFTIRLVACEEALARGMAPAGLPEDAPPELRRRLLRSLDCVQLLQKLRPQRGAGETEDACPTRIGRFEIRCPLGRGGFGIVYRAYDPMLCREVALKIPRADALVDADCRARFEREARAAAGLDHPNLVPVHEAGQLGPICYIAFAYCPGSDLAAWLKQRTAPVRCVEAARLVRVLARAIHYAHGRGILHRDLKPSNVLLSPVPRAASESQEHHWQPDQDGALIPRVTDFGLAKFAAGEQAQTKTGDLLGTPSYMAPEQVDGRLGQIGPATDVYALGVILYEVVTGRPPFWSESPVETLLQVKTTEPVKPSRLRPELPRDLETICLKCLAKEPRKRYASAEALAEDLGRFLAGRPIQARPIGRTEQVWKWSRRHPGVATSLAALFLVTFLGTIAVLSQWSETQSALGEAVLREGEARKAQQAEAILREKSEVALYHHRVALAHHEWLAGNVGRSAQLLDECRPDLRHWEWRYVRRLCDSAVVTCAARSTEANKSVAFSPDGRWLAAAAGRWNGDKPGEVRFWDAATGELRWTGLEHTGPVMSVAFSRDGNRLASTSVNWGKSKAGEIIIWDTATGNKIATFANGLPGNFGVTFSPDGERLATAGADGKIRLWDAATGQQLFDLEGHKADAYSVAFSPDGDRLASAGWDGAAIIWDLATRRELQHLPGPKAMRSAAFSRDGRQLVTTFDQSVKIWDAAGGQLLRTFWEHHSLVACAIFAPDGKHVASTDSAGIVHVWDVETGQIFRTFRGHTGFVSWAAFNPDGSRLATAGREGTVRVWDITREQDADLLSPNAGAVNVVFSPTGRRLAAAGYSQFSGVEKRVRVWAMDNPAEPRAWEGHAGSVRCVAFSPDEKLLASGSTDRTVRLWDLAAEQTLCVFKEHAKTVTGVAFNRDGTRLASSSLDKTVRLWDVAAKQPLSCVLGHPHPVHDVAFAPDGKRLVAVGGDGMECVWNPATATKLFDFPGHDDVVDHAAFSPDGRWLATAGNDKTIRIWEMAAEPADGQAAVPVHILTGHTDRISGLSFSSDGRRLASAGAGDQTIRVWDVITGHEALALHSQPAHLGGVAFGPNGRLLVSASIRDIKIWNAGDGTAPPNRAR